MSEEVESDMSTQELELKERNDHKELLEREFASPRNGIVHQFGKHNYVGNHKKLMEFQYGTRVEILKSKGIELVDEDIETYKKHLYIGIDVGDNKFVYLSLVNVKEVKRSGGDGLFSKETYTLPQDYFPILSYDFFEGQHVVVVLDDKGDYTANTGRWALRFTVSPRPEDVSKVTDVGWSAEIKFDERRR
jgi:hypothetical protein